MKALALALGALYCAPSMADQTLELEIAYSTLHLTDWAQSRAIARDPVHYFETNKLLGRKPQQHEVNRYFAATLATHWAITYALPEPYRPYWQWGSIGVEAIVVGRNVQLGVSANWR